jgi:hypothetical protein
LELAVTIGLHRLNRSYLTSATLYQNKNATNKIANYSRLVRLAGIEPTTLGFGG